MSEVSQARVTADHPRLRVRRAIHLGAVLAAVLGLVLVLLLAAFAHGTTAGITTDVHGVNHVLARILIVPVNVLEGLLIIGTPVAVGIELLLGRRPRQYFGALLAGALAMSLSFGLAWGIEAWGSDSLRAAFQQGVGPDWRLYVPVAIAAVMALLLVAGPRGRRRTVRWSSNLLILTVLVVLISGSVSLPGVASALLLGVIAAQGLRFAFGVQSERAYGSDLIEAVRHAGFEPDSLERIARPLADSGAATGATATRQYLLTTGGQQHDVVVLDGDKQVLNWATRWWRSVRLRGVEPTADFSLKAAVDRHNLLLFSAQNAGVNTHRLLGSALEDDSAVLVLERLPGQTLAETEAPSPELPAEIWKQVLLAHAAGIAHRSLSAQAFTVEGEQVWITGWHQGETFASTLAKRLDLAQVLTTLALVFGPQAAVTSARFALPAEDLAALGPLLQTVALPGATRSEVRARKGFMNQVREEYARQLPDAQTDPAPIARFSLKSLVMTGLTVAAIFVVVTTINFQQILEALRSANPWWIVAAFAVATLPWLGAAMTLVAFAPGRLPLVRSTEVQMASSFIALAAPAGIGPAGVNLRFMNRRGIETPTALATTALVQLSQFVITVLILLILLVTQGAGGLVSLPSGSMLWALGAVVAILAVVLLVPPLRRWLWAKARPTLAQVRPRFLAAVGHPGRLALGVGGNAIHALAYVFAFYAALRAFGYDLPLVDAAVIYLVGNTIGALVPTPGGLGGVEGALVAGLTAAGIPAAIGVSITMLFRVASYWIQVPIGWVAMRYVQAKGDL